jgi:hypothetical protein
MAPVIATREGSWKKVQNWEHHETHFLSQILRFFNNLGKMLTAFLIYCLRAGMVA